ncbi:hypothetical protein HPB48_020714 [Haemaphysalis longicornis]|uniref:Uncharacterized protein n=1 Tax=Haemaphysalis longicornis TaxID=44386 RepID=A0A9J6G840_HAELO|nr:hypothetical protein HPB48_020714 [Haemaphysalis longicornis]
MAHMCPGSINGKKSLVDVILEYFIVDTEEAIMIEKFLRDNIGIRTFELKNCSWRSGTIYFPAYKKADLETVTPRIISWLSILQANSALEKLRFTFHCFSPVECAVFLEELARNRHLKNVYIEDLQEYCCCLNSRRPSSNSEEKGDLLQGRRPEILLIECKPIRRIRLNLWTSEDLDWFVTVVLPLQFSHRVTDFTLILSLLDPTPEAALAIAKFIEESKTLAQLVMDLGCPKNDRNELKISAVQKTILGGVHRNSSIKDFVLCYTDCTDVEAEELAHTIRKNKTVCYLNLNLGLNAGHVFLSQLFPRIWCNYAVLRCAIMGIPYLLESAYHNLSNVAARNQRLVARAAKFTLGSSTKPCAEAFELVSSNPGLVDELCELVSVEETEASRMIRQRLRWLQNFNSFMQVSGVVKRRVACHMNISGWLHLDDVDEYSWRCVRNYLRLADIQK